MPITPPHPQRVLPDDPDLLEIKLLVDRVLNHGEAALLGREGLGVRGVTALLPAAGAGALSAKKLGGYLSCGAISPRDGKTTARVTFDLGWHLAHRGM